MSTTKQSWSISQVTKLFIGCFPIDDWNSATMICFERKKSNECDGLSLFTHTHTHTHKRAWCFHFNLSTIKTNFEEYNLLFNVDILKDVWRVHKFSFGRHRKSIDVLISLLKASIAVDSNVISIMLTYENQTEHLSIKFPIDELSQSILILEYSQD